MIFEPSGVSADSSNAKDSALETYLTELAKRSGDVTALRVRFRQEKKLRLVRRLRVSTAELVFSKGRLSVTTRGKSGGVDSRLLISGGELKILYPTLKKLEVYPVAKDGASAGAGTTGGADVGRRAMMPLFSGDWKSLSKDFTISMTERKLEPDGRAEDAVVLTLLPKSKKASVKKLEVVLVDYRIREYVQIERRGDRVRMQILAWDGKAKVDDKEFELEVPKETKVIRIGT